MHLIESEVQGDHPSWTFVERDPESLAPGNDLNKFAERSFPFGSVLHLTRHHRAPAPASTSAAISPRLTFH